jgi:hypothetical protein
MNQTISPNHLPLRLIEGRLRIIKGDKGFPGANRTDPARSGKPTKPGNGGIPLKDQLFDKGIIGNLAKRNIERDEKKNKTFAFDTSEYKFLIYNQRLKERIESIWVYPRNASERGIYGDLMIRFTITKNGQLGAVELVRTSGHKDLDDAAIKALKTELRTCCSMNGAWKLHTQKGTLFILFMDNMFDKRDMRI